MNPGEPAPLKLLIRGLRILPAEDGADHCVTRKQSNVSAEDAFDSLPETAIRPDDHERPRRQDFASRGFKHSGGRRVPTSEGRHGR